MTFDASANAKIAGVIDMLKNEADTAEALVHHCGLLDRCELAAVIDSFASKMRVLVHTLKSALPMSDVTPIERLIVELRAERERAWNKTRSPQGMDESLAYERAITLHSCAERLEAALAASKLSPETPEPRFSTGGYQRLRTEIEGWKVEVSRLMDENDQLRARLAARTGETPTVPSPSQLDQLIADWRKQADKDWHAGHDDIEDGVWAYQHEANGRAVSARKCATELEQLRQSAAPQEPTLTRDQESA